MLEEGLQSRPRDALTRLAQCFVFLVFFSLSVLTWGCASGGSQGPTGLSVGVVDPQRVLKETRKGQQLAETLNAFMKDRQVLVELEQKELRTLENELMAQSTVLRPVAKKRKEEQFRQKMMAYQEKVAELNREVQEKQQALQDEFRQQVQEVVSQIASQKNLGLVLEYGANSGTLFYESSWDISTDVIQALNQASGESGLP